MKKFFILSVVMVIMVGFLIVRIEMISYQTNDISNSLTGYITDGIRQEAQEIIDWNIEKGLSPVLIYAEWIELDWQMSIGNLKHVLSSEIGRCILVDHFGEDEIKELENAINGNG